MYLEIQVCLAAWHMNIAELGLFTDSWRMNSWPWQMSFISPILLFHPTAILHQPLRPWLSHVPECAVLRTSGHSRPSIAGRSLPSLSSLMRLSHTSTRPGAIFSSSTRMESSHPKPLLNMLPRYTRMGHPLTLSLGSSIALSTRHAVQVSSKPLHTQG